MYTVQLEVQHCRNNQVHVQYTEKLILYQQYVRDKSKTFFSSRRILSKNEIKISSMKFKACQIHG